MILIKLMLGSLAALAASTCGAENPGLVDGAAMEFADPDVVFIPSLTEDKVEEKKSFVESRRRLTDDETERVGIPDSSDMNSRSKRKDANLEEKSKEEKKRIQKQQNSGVTAVPLAAAEGEFSNVYFLIIVTVCGVAGAIAVIFITVCVIRLRRNAKMTQEIAYGDSPTYNIKTVPSLGNYAGANPAYGPYGGVGAMDGALALSAQKFQYQREKERMLQMEREKNQMEPVNSLSMDNADDVYETPGLAPLWDVEVNSPLYNEEVTPSTTPRGNTPAPFSAEDGSSPLPNGFKTPEERRTPDNLEQNNNNNNNNLAPDDGDNNNNNNNNSGINGDLSDSGVR